MNPFQSLIQNLTSNVAEKIASEVKAGLSPVGPYLRRLALGVVFILASLFAWVLGLAFAAVSFFVYLANQPTYDLPALYTALLCFLVALVLVLAGLLCLRRPR